MRLSLLAFCGVMLVAATACTGTSSPGQTTGARTTSSSTAFSSPSAGRATAEVPSVTGLSGRVALVRLQAAGLRTVRFDASRSRRPASIVLVQRPKAGSRVMARGKVEVTISAGDHPVGQFVFVSGISTCTMDRVPIAKPCVGGPVPARVIKRSHNP